MVFRKFWVSETPNLSLQISESKEILFSGIFPNTNRPYKGRQCIFLVEVPNWKVDYCSSSEGASLPGKFGTRPQNFWYLHVWKYVFRSVFGQSFLSSLKRVNKHTQKWLPQFLQHECHLSIYGSLGSSSVKCPKHFMTFQSCFHCVGKVDMFKTVEMHHPFNSDIWKRFFLLSFSN